MLRARVFASLAFVWLAVTPGFLWGHDIHLKLLKRVELSTDELFNDDVQILGNRMYASACDDQGGSPRLIELDLATGAVTRLGPYFVLSRSADRLVVAAQSPDRTFHAFWHDPMTGATERIEHDELLVDVGPKALEDFRYAEAVSFMGNSFFAVDRHKKGSDTFFEVDVRRGTSRPITVSDYVADRDYSFLPFAISHDRRRLLVMDAPGSIVVWDISRNRITGRLEPEFPVDSLWWNTVCFVESDRFMFPTEGERRNTWTVYDLEGEVRDEIVLDTDRAILGLWLTDDLTRGAVLFAEGDAYSLWIVDASDFARYWRSDIESRAGSTEGWIEKEKVALHQYPLPEASIVGYLRNGDQVCIVEESRATGDLCDWRRVVGPQGVTGWASRGDIETGQ